MQRTYSQGGYSQSSSHKRKKTYAPSGKKSKPKSQALRIYKGIPVVNSSTIGGFPAKMRVKFRYAEEFTLNAAIGGVMKYFYANSIYHPSSAAVDPKNYDAFSTVYGKYRVLSSKITVTATANTADPPANFKGCYVGVGVFEDETYINTSTKDFLEDGSITKKVLQAGLIYNIGRSSQQITRYYSPKKELGINDVMDADNLHVAIDAHPTESPVYFNVYAWTQHGNDPGTAYLYAVIDYDVVLDERLI